MLTGTYQSLKLYNIDALIVVTNLSQVFDSAESQYLIVEKSDKFAIIKVPDYLAEEIPDDHLAVFSFNEFCDSIKQNRFHQIKYIKLYDIDPANLPIEFWKLLDLQTLSLAGNGLQNIPPEIKQLVNLQSLNLSYNHLLTLPAEIGQLVHLRSLDLSNNRLATLPVEIINLRNLNYLNLAENKLGLPPEILISEPRAILNYFSWILRGERSLNETKMLTVGQGSVGKTSLIKRLTQDKFDFNEFKTDGIAISYWQVDSFWKRPEEKLQGTNLGTTDGNLEVGNSLLVTFDENLEVGSSILVEPKDGSEIRNQLNDQNLILDLPKNENDAELQASTPTHVINLNKEHKIRLNIWDFGGQEIMHATHQFFLTKRSLYLLVLDSRLTQEENRVEYWLKIIQSFGGESPVLIVGNKIDQHQLDIDRTGLQKKYSNIVGILETSAATGAGIEKLNITITTLVNNLPHVHDLLPETWFTIKTKLEVLGRETNFITHDKYLELCSQNDVSDDISQRTLIGFLHDLGVVLYFQDDPRLEALGILNPQWVTNGVYQILNSHALFQNKGVLTISTLNETLHLPEYPRGKRLFIVDMMKKFELCYDLESNKTFLVPDLLPKDEPVDVKFNGIPAFEYVYPVLPSSVITRFIVRMNQHIHENCVWRTGVLLKIGENRALVKADVEDRKITIAIGGLEHTRRDALSAIRYQLDEIHNSIKGLDTQKRVPIPSAPNAEPLEYDYLLMLEQEGQETHLVKNGTRLVKINIREVLSGIEREAQRRGAGGNVTNIYVGGNFDGNLTVGDNNQSIKESYNKITSAEIDSELKETLKQLVYAVEVMAKSLPAEQAAETTEDLSKLVEEATKPTPDKKWYSVSIEGLIKAAKNVEKVGEPVINLSRKVFSLLTGGMIK